jgi:hypothetical protein
LSEPAVSLEMRVSAPFGPFSQSSGVTNGATREPIGRVLSGFSPEPLLAVRFRQSVIGHYNFQIVRRPTGIGRKLHATSQARETTSDRNSEGFQMVLFSFFVQRGLCLALSA